MAAPDVIDAHPAADDERHQVGAALLSGVLARADHDDTPAYLEASCP
jgi:uncharacterized protein